MKNKKIAIVYDWIDSWGGVERVLLNLHNFFPEAVFYSSYIDEKKALWAKKLKVRTSFIQKLPSFIKKNRVVSIPFYVYAFESFLFDEYDLVISVTSSFAKGIITKPHTFHLCYLLTPPRFLWGMEDDYVKNKLLRSIRSPFLTALRKWDYLSAQRPDKLITISNTSADRCLKYYGRKADVIYPPFDINYWTKLNAKKVEGIPEKYFLIVSRLESYKKVDLAIKSFNLNGLNLVIAGEGKENNNLKKLAKTNVSFLGQVEDEELVYLYKNAEALIMPQEEDFGYISLEAQSYGCPVIAYRGGGAIETVRENISGVFFDKQDVISINDTIARFHTLSYNWRNVLRGNHSWLEKFSKEKFVTQINKITKAVLH